MAHALEILASDPHRGKGDRQRRTHPLSVYKPTCVTGTRVSCTSGVDFRGGLVLVSRNPEISSSLVDSPAANDADRCTSPEEVSGLWGARAHHPSQRFVRCPMRGNLAYERLVF